MAAELPSENTFSPYFLTILGQYNKLIDYDRSISQRALLMLFAYIGFHYSHLEQFHLSDPTIRSLVIAGHVFVMGFVLLLRYNNLVRNTDCLDTLNHLIRTTPTQSLRAIGIREREPWTIFWTWYGCYLVVHVIFVKVAYIPNWGF